MNKQKLTTILFLIAIYLISTGISYAIFSQVAPAITDVTPAVQKTGKAGEDRISFDDDQPRTEPCPLNGELHSKKQKQWWGGHRPLGIMIENHTQARPQSGLSFADVVYEAVAEGSITRFLAIYHCEDAGIVGPVRSARTYYLDYISEYGEFPLYAHVGGANTPGPANAIGQISDYGWTIYNDLNQFSLGCPVYCQDRTRTGREVDTEHTMYSTTTKLWDVAKKRGITNIDKDGNEWDEKFVAYSFKDDGSASGAEAKRIHLEPWEDFRDYAVDWKYDSASNSYKREHGGKPHTDRDTGKQLITKNVVVLIMPESRANDGYEGNVHLLYATKGSGKAVVFIDGKRINGTWRKANRTARTLLFDASGSPIKFNRGQIWFTILPTTGVLEVE